MDRATVVVWEAVAVAVAKRRDEGSSARRCRVEVVIGGCVRHGIALEEGRHLVGRGEWCAVQIADPAVAEAHAEIVITGETVTIRGCDGAARTMVRWCDAVVPMTVGDQDVVWLSGSTCLTFANTGRVDSIH